MECISGEYLSRFEAAFSLDESTVRKKLKEYEELGLLRAEKSGREVLYRRTDNEPFPLDSWVDALVFYSEADPMGVVGSFPLDKLDECPDLFRFKHHYILHALDSDILGHTGVRHQIVCIPNRLEYSAKDDKFRLLAADTHRENVINLARVQSCQLLEEYDPDSFHPPEKRLHVLLLLLRDERNGLERVLLHFSHFEKETRKLDDRLYEIKLRYDQEDETELLIRVLSFGPVLEVKAPAEFIALVRDRVEWQAAHTFYK